jgi:hypothetical protein
MNSKMFKSEMVVLTNSEKTDMADADVVMGWMLEDAARALVIKIKIENWCDVIKIEIKTIYHWNQSIFQ